MTVNHCAKLFFWASNTMFSTSFYIIIFAVCALVTKFGVDAYCQLAPKLGLVDHPDINRKLHEKPIAVGGGVVIFCVTFFAVFVLAMIAKKNVEQPLYAMKSLLPLLIAATMTVSIGLMDDKWGMNGKMKLFFQILASSIVIFFAGAYSKISAFGMTIELGHFFYPIGVFWLVGMINSVNLLDGADGVSVTVGFLMVVAAGIIALINGYMVLLCVALIFSGSLLGFFCCNRPPAKVYLGDTGSMLIGLVAAMLLLRVCSTNNFSINIVPPLAIALIPILDSVYAVVRRINAGRSIFTPDRGHIHHRLQEKVGKGYQLLGILALLVLPGCIAAIVGVTCQNDWIPVLVILGVIGIATTTGVFGREEVRLLVHRMMNQYKKCFRVKSYEERGEVFHFQGTGPWLALWEDFIASLQSMECVKAHLDINMPFLHEDYSSEWKNMDLQDQKEFYLEFSLPLTYENQCIGRLKMTFDNRTSSTFALLYQANELYILCTKYIGDYVRQQKHALPTSPNYLKEDKTAKKPSLIAK